MVFLRAIMKRSFQCSMYLKLSALILFAVLHASALRAQRLEGVVHDANNTEPLSGATILLPLTGIKALTDQNGHFALEITAKATKVDTAFWVILYGYQKLKVVCDQKNAFYDIVLTPLAKEIRGVTVRAPKENLSSIQLPIELAKRIPTLSGEADIIRSFQLMPGVSAGNEATSALYVRGGSPDQNLFLLDNIPLYYVNHIGGFVSTFDPNMIGSVQLHKGNFPAKYSGRLSSVVAIQMRDGNQKQTHKELSFGLLTTKFQIDGPFKKDSSWTYLISVRRLNFDLLIRMLARLDSEGAASSGYTFYDLNAKVVKRFANHSVLRFTYFDGRDRIFVKSKLNTDAGLSIAYKNNITWGNRVGGLHYFIPFKNKLLGNFTLGSSNFYYASDVLSKYSSENTQSNESAFLFASKVNDVLFKAQFQYVINERQSLDFGVNSCVHLFRPGTLKAIQPTSSLFLESKVLATEHALYGDFKWRFNEQFLAHLSAATTAYTTKDTCFWAFEPRLSLKWALANEAQLQLGFSKMNQNLHYVAYAGSALPTDLWMPATKAFVPERAYQTNFTFVYPFEPAQHTFELTLEAFYKVQTGLLEFKEGLSFYALDAIESKLDKNGRGQIYGFEFLLEKADGKTTGWLAYTWSKNMRQFETINNGQAFPFKYDRRHVVSLVVNHDFSDKIHLTGTWVYTTGVALTMGQGVYNQIDVVNAPLFGQVMYDLSPAQIYTGKNAYRMPAYHRLDISLQTQKETPKGERIWSFSVYNLYNQMNPFFLFFKANDSGVQTLHQLTLFPLIPSVNYQFRLK